jgi:hypothetical protein
MRFDTDITKNQLMSNFSPTLHLKKKKKKKSFAPMTMTVLANSTVTADLRLGLAMTQPWVIISGDFSTKHSLKNQF